MAAGNITVKINQKSIDKFTKVAKELHRVGDHLEKKLDRVSLKLTNLLKKASKLETKLNAIKKTV